MADNGTLGRNPFAIKATTPTRNGDDQSKESRPLVAPPTLVLNQESPRPSGFVLKPSALSAQASNLKIYNTPTTINNGKVNENAKVDKTEAGQESTEPQQKGEEQSLQKEPEAAEQESDKESTTEKKNTENNEVVFGQNLDNFVSNVPSLPDAASTTANEESSFVFGQNLRERVTNADSVEAAGEASREFTFAAAACGGEKNGEDSDTGSKGEKRSLNETAEEYQQRMENEAKKSKLEEVEVLTGEEDESNVLQINCKLYIYEGAQYHERGRGVLRLNDKQDPSDGSIQSRVVMRTQGILRVMLNTKVWSEMSVEHPSNKTVRISAYSPDGTSGIYLIQCTPKEADQLFNALEWRVAALKRAQNKNEQEEEEDDAEKEVTPKADEVDNNDSNTIE